MAQAGYTPISLYYSTTASQAPSAGNLTSGELAINITDGKLYFKNASNVVTLLASAAGASGDVVGPASATDNAIPTYDGTTGKLIKNNSGVTISSNIITASGFSGPLNGSVGATSPSTGVFTQIDITAQGDLRLQDTTGGEYVALQAPGTLASSYTLTLPVDDGNSGQVLTTDGSGNLSWSTNAGGDVFGPASSTDEAIARFDLTTGKLIQNSVVTITDAGAVAGATQLNVDNIQLNGNDIATTDSNGNLTLTPNGTGYVVFSGTQAILVPKGNNTTQRPGTPVTGMLRYNTTTDEFEGYSGSSASWKSVGGAAISNDTSTASNLYPVFVSATTGTASTLNTSNAKLLYKPSTGEFQASAPVASNGILVNANAVAADYTIASGYNGLSAGPVTVNSGITVTISSGSNWTVV